MILVMLGEIGFPGFHQVSAKELPKLEIIRKANPKPEKKADQVPGDPNEIITRVYVVDPTFLSIGTEPESAQDPFAEDEALVSSAADRKTAREILEAGGISFPQGTSSYYNPSVSQLLVRQTYKNILLIESFLDKSHSGLETENSFRFEIFELPASRAQEILTSSEDKQDHSEERASVLNMVIDQRARLISHTQLAVNKGKRAKVTEGPEYRYIASYKRDQKTKHLLPVFETQNVGTSIEIQTHALESNSDIAFEFDFTHHYAAPEMDTAGINIAGSSGVVAASKPIFHALKIQSSQHMLMKNNGVKLIGSYRITKKNEGGTEPVIGLVFLKVFARNTDIISWEVL